MKRLNREHDAAISAAWINAKLTAYAPAKSSEFTKLDKLVGPAAATAAQPAAGQTPDEMIAIAHRWTAATKPKRRSPSRTR